MGFYSRFTEFYNEMISLFKEASANEEINEATEMVEATVEDTLSKIAISYELGTLSEDGVIEALTKIIEFVSKYILAGFATTSGAFRRCDWASANSLIDCMVSFCFDVTE